MKKNVLLIVLASFLCYTQKAFAVRISPVMTSVAAKRLVGENSDIGFSHILFWLSIGCLFFLGRGLQPWVVGVLVIISIISGCYIWG